MHRERDQFFGHGPLEDAADAFYAGVDRLAAPLLFDELLPNDLEGQRTELGRRHLAVQFADVADGGFQVPHFIRRVSLLVAVVLLGEVEIRDHHLSHGYAFGIGWRTGWGRGESEFETCFRGE